MVSTRYFGRASTFDIPRAPGALKTRRFINRRVITAVSGGKSGEYGSTLGMANTPARTWDHSANHSQNDRPPYLAKLNQTRSQDPREWPKMRKFPTTGLCPNKSPIPSNILPNASHMLKPMHRTLGAFYRHLAYIGNERGRNASTPMPVLWPSDGLGTGTAKIRLKVAKYNTVRLITLDQCNEEEVTCMSLTSHPQINLIEVEREGEYGRGQGRTDACRDAFDGRPSLPDMDRSTINGISAQAMIVTISVNFLE
ncbi:hypothetical protein B0H16DRAFT_1455939 [Mycena metata]|uniref:Uncharacterized protein n=1 Tax=Mycena metata TaxID=1033252 RepID=A0AAD7NGT7_9AGAR|nr:hypothetical protein B0H16DRAFT_1455939 [Mycena metata]